MTERQTAMTPTREERSLWRTSPFSGGGPFTTLQRFADEMDRIFDDFGLGRRSTGTLLGRLAEETWEPAVDVFQRNDQLVVRADVPGLTKDEISVDVTDNSVTIQGERKREHEEEREGVYRTERSYGSFCRVIALPEGAITDQAKASFRDGVLEITMPAPPASRGRRLEITGEVKK